MPGIGPVLAISFVGYSSALCVFGLWGAPMLNDVYGLDAIARGNVMLVMATAMLAGSLSYGPMDQTVRHAQGRGDGELRRLGRGLRRSWPCSTVRRSGS